VYVGRHHRLVLLEGAGKLGDQPLPRSFTSLNNSRRKVPVLSV
jgi:hypothetical protein